MKIVVVEDSNLLVKQLGSVYPSFRKVAVLEMWRSLSILKAAIIQNIRFRSGLRVRTGTLLNSIQYDVKIDRNAVVGTIGPENVPYAWIHEFGGFLPPTFIMPRQKSSLAFKAGGATFFSKGHWLPRRRIPARPFLAPAVEEKLGEILDRFGNIVTNTMETP